MQTRTGVQVIFQRVHYTTLLIRIRRLWLACRRFLARQSVSPSLNRWSWNGVLQLHLD